MSKELNVAGSENGVEAYCMICPLEVLSTRRSGWNCDARDLLAVRGILLVVCAMLLAPVIMGQEITGFITIRDGRFVDEAGRHVILHGINVGRSYKPYVSWHQPEDYARMREWGFNCVRLLTVWAAIEPECGKYDEDYLCKLDKRIAWAKENGLYVMLDMHQGLWGEKAGGGGAPAWATLDEGKPRGPKGAVWSDAYFTSPMIQTAFDKFYANKPGPDDVGIQDRFALAWQHVARRYADEPAVVGYDLFNEPFMGTEIIFAPIRLAQHMAKIVAEENGLSQTRALLKLYEKIQTMEGRIELIKKVDNIELYRSLIDAVEPLSKTFEKDKLSPMYRRIAKAIREVDERHILFIEPNPSTNAGVRSALEPVPSVDGLPDPLQALAPHVYDIFVDTPAVAQASGERIGVIFEHHKEHAQYLCLPLLIGEWGAFCGSADALPAAQKFVEQLERTLASDTYWSFRKNTEQASYFMMLTRPYPSAVSGTILSYRTALETRLFECSWTEDPVVKEPTRIYVPALWYPSGYDIEVTPPGQGHHIDPATPNSTHGYVLIPGTGKNVERRLVIRPKS